MKIMEHDQNKHIEKKEGFRYIIFLLKKNPLFLFGILIIFLMVIASIFPSYITPFPEDATTNVNFSEKFREPSLTHPFGTDQLGRDIFTRVVFGARMSLRIAITVVFIALMIGIPLGLIAGFFGGVIDDVIMRITDMFLAFPPLLLPMAITAALGASITNAMIAIAVSWFPWHARVIRSKVVTVKEELYVESARSIGASNSRLILRHIFPNCVAPVFIQASMDMGYAILTAAALSFIGLGAKPPTIEWGLMVTTARANFLDFWWTATFPGLAIFVVVLAFNFIGDGLRDIFDPKLRV